MPDIMEVHRQSLHDRDRILELHRQSLHEQNLMASAEKEQQDLTALPAQSVFEGDEDQATETTEEEKVADVAPGPQYPSGIKFALIFGGLLISMFLVALDMTIVSTAIPKITNTYGSLQDVGWYGSAYFLTLASFQSFWGKMYKNFPLRWSFVLALVIFEAGSALCGAAPSSAVLIVGRAIQGMGGSGVTGGCYTILANIVPPERVAPFAGTFGAIYSLASVAGPLLGGVFTEQLSWRWCFYINLPFGVFAIGPVAIFYNTPSGARWSGASAKEIFLQMDPLGLTAIISALVCYMIALEKGGKALPWNSAKIIGLFIGWILLMIAFVVIQAFQKDNYSSVNRRILKNRTILACCVFIFFMNACNFLTIYYLPIYFQAVLGVSAQSSGIRNLPLILSSSVATMVSCALLRHTKLPKYHIILGSMLVLTGAGLLYTLDQNTDMGKYLGYQILFGSGVGIAIQIPIITSQAQSQGADIPVVTATVLFFQLISGAMSVSMAESIFNNKLAEGLASLVPNISSTLVSTVGASNLSTAFSGADLAGVIAAYIQGLNATWLAGVALAATSLVIAIGAPIKRTGVPAKRVVDKVKMALKSGYEGEVELEDMGRDDESKKEEDDEDVVVGGEKV